MDNKIFLNVMFRIVFGFETGGRDSELVNGYSPENTMRETPVVLHGKLQVPCLEKLLSNTFRTAERSIYIALQ